MAKMMGKQDSTINHVAKRTTIGRGRLKTVSYTHLTLPTMLPV